MFSQLEPIYQEDQQVQLIYMGLMTEIEESNVFSELEKKKILGDETIQKNFHHIAKSLFLFKVLSYKNFKFFLKSFSNFIKKYKNDFHNKIATLKVTLWKIKTLSTNHGLKITFDMLCNIVDPDVFNLLLTCQHNHIFSINNIKKILGYHALSVAMVTTINDCKLSPLTQLKFDYVFFETRELYKQLTAPILKVVTTSYDLIVLILLYTTVNIPNAKFFETRRNNFFTTDAGRKDENKSKKLQTCLQQKLYYEINETIQLTNLLAETPGTYVEVFPEYKTGLLERAKKDLPGKLHSGYPGCKRKFYALRVNCLNSLLFELYDSNRFFNPRNPNMLPILSERIIELIHDKNIYEVLDLLILIPGHYKKVLSPDCQQHLESSKSQLSAHVNITSTLQALFDESDDNCLNTLLAELRVTRARLSLLKA